MWLPVKKIVYGKSHKFCILSKSLKHIKLIYYHIDINVQTWNLKMNLFAWFCDSFISCKGDGYAWDVDMFSAYIKNSYPLLHI
jgi:hypothetical protein